MLRRGTLKAPTYPSTEPPPVDPPFPAHTMRGFTVFGLMEFTRSERDRYMDAWKQPLNCCAYCHVCHWTRKIHNHTASHFRVMPKRLQRCSHCAMTYYCSTECQERDWQRHNYYCSIIHRNPPGQIVTMIRQRMVGQNGTDKLQPFALRGWQKPRSRR